MEISVQPEVSHYAVSFQSRDGTARNCLGWELKKRHVQKCFILLEKVTFKLTYCIQEHTIMSCEGKISAISVYKSERTTYPR